MEYHDVLPNISLKRMSVYANNLAWKRSTLGKIQYRQKETPQLFSWEFSCNQLAHRESIACNWL